MSTQTKTINFKGHKLVVEFDYTPYCKGATERGTGIPLEPDDQEDIEEISSVVCDDKDGNFVELLDEGLIEQMKEELLELMNEPPEEEERERDDY
jgi:hypothetical protein